MLFHIDTYFFGNGLKPISKVLGFVFEVVVAVFEALRHMPASPHMLCFVFSFGITHQLQCVLFLDVHIYSSVKKELQTNKLPDI